uniref:Activin_recp domain-containing protein n=1 Tax=Panagrellus redivivus TaxID=6233 RepID=A0A7E4V4V6_PANRE
MSGKCITMRMANGIKSVYAAVSGTLLTFNGQYCHVGDSECQQAYPQTVLAENYKKEIETYKKILAESQCCVCTHDGTKPCLNDGVCAYVSSTSAMTVTLTLSMPLLPATV